MVVKSATRFLPLDTDHTSARHVGYLRRQMKHNIDSANCCWISDIKIIESEINGKIDGPHDTLKESCGRRNSRKSIGLLVDNKLRK